MLLVACHFDRGGFAASPTVGDAALDGAALDGAADGAALDGRNDVAWPDAKSDGTPTEGGERVDGGDATSDLRELADAIHDAAVDRAPDAPQPDAPQPDAPLPPDAPSPPDIGIDRPWPDQFVPDARFGTCSDAGSLDGGPPSPNAKFFSDPAPTVSTSGKTVILHKELNAFSNYGSPSGDADILYSGETSTWTFTVPPSVTGITAAFFKVSIVADDHYGQPANTYRYRAWTNGAKVVDSAGVPHGSPFGKLFTNWVRRDYVSLKCPPGKHTITISNVSTTTSSDWLAIDWIELHLVRP